MGISKASGGWRGDLKSGEGRMKPEHGPEVPFSLKTRFEGERGSNPEEMIGAALSGCFSMALTAALSKAGATPKSVSTTADVRLEKDGEGFTIRHIGLTTTVEADGVEDEAFQRVATETKAGCPVSKALAGVEITLVARLGQ